MNLRNLKRSIYVPPSFGSRTNPPILLFPPVPAVLYRVTLNFFPPRPGTCSAFPILLDINLQRVWVSSHVFWSVPFFAIPLPSPFSRAIGKDPSFCPAEHPFRHFATLCPTPPFAFSSTRPGIQIFPDFVPLSPPSPPLPGKLPDGASLAENPGCLGPRHPSWHF